MIGFNALSKQAMLVVVDVIWNDIEEPLANLFTLEWYDNHRYLDPIIGTLDSYFGDIDTYIVENYFRRLVSTNYICGG